MSDKLRINPRLSSVQVDSHIWGLFNPNDGEYLFIDVLDQALLQLVPSIGSRALLIDACKRIASERKQSTGTIDFEARLRRLETFGAILHDDSEQHADVLLIDPPAMNDLQVGTKGPPMGLGYLSSALQQNGMRPAQILDLRTISSHIGYNRAAHAAAFARYAARLAPKIIGITAVSATIDNAIFIARLCKMLLPDSYVVLGGPHVSYEWQPILNEHDFVDLIVRGEGELSFPRVVERVLGHTGSRGAWDFSDVLGVAWRDADGTPRTSGWSQMEADLDSIRVPDMHHGVINDEPYYDFGYPHIMSARGCPFKCSFCSTATFTGRSIRFRSNESVISEIQYYWEKYNIEKFSFDDDIFTVNRKRALSLCEAIEKAPFAGELIWGCNTRLDCIDFEVIDALQRAGCRNILFGVESGDIDVQYRFGKGKRSLNGFREKMEYMLERDIYPQLNFILGLPGEDQQSIQKIMALIDRFPQVACAFNFLSIYPGTPLEQQMESLGIRLLGQKSEEKYSLSAPTLSTPTMSDRQQIEAYLQLHWQRKRQRAEQGAAPIKSSAGATEASVAASEASVAASEARRESSWPGDSDEDAKERSRAARSLPVI